MIVNFDKYIDNRNANLSKFEGLRVYTMRAKIIVYLCGLRIWILILLRQLFRTSKEVSHGVFGYYGSNKSFINSVKMWMKAGMIGIFLKNGAPWCTELIQGLEWACERSASQEMRSYFFPHLLFFF